MSSTEQVIAQMRRAGLMLLLLVGCWLVQSGWVHGAPPAGEAGATGTARHFDQQRLERYRSNPRYNYDRRGGKPKKQKKKTESRTSTSSRAPDAQYGSKSGSGGGLAWLVWVVIIVLVLLILLQFLNVDFKKVLKKKSDEAVVQEVAEKDPEVDLEQMNFERLLQEAIDQGRFRYAVRLLYLKALKDLSARSLIQWRLEKTNHDYLRELRGHALAPAFGDITWMFEYVWYGEFPVDQGHFAAARARFDEFNEELRRERAQ